MWFRPPIHQHSDYPSRDIDRLGHYWNLHNRSEICRTLSGSGGGETARHGG
jgi:hypothetical protein